MKKTMLITMMLVFVTTVSFASETKTNPNNDIENIVQPKVSPFVWGIVKGDLEFIKKMIAFGSDVNEESGGMTPLMYAARYNKTDIIKLLVQRGAKVNVKNAKGFNAVRFAELSNAKEAMVLLENM